MINVSEIWFTDEEHKLNYYRLIQRFPSVRNGGEYGAAAYFSSCSEVYHRIDWSKQKNPMEWYWGEWIGKNDNDPDGYLEESDIVGRLSGTFTNLARLAVELYTSRPAHKPFDLVGLIGNADGIRMSMFLTMVDIRRGVQTYRHLLG